MPDETALAVAALGDPRDPRTWSGTPANVVSALERTGMEIVGFDARISRRAREAAYFARYQAGGPLRKVRLSRDYARTAKLLATDARADYHWSRPARAYRSRQLLQRLHDARCDRVLHMASLSLPLKSAPGVSHYLYCDGTWHTLRPRPEMDWRFSEQSFKVMAEVERASFESVEHFFTTGEYVRQDLISHYGVDPGRVTAVGTGRGNIEPAGADAKDQRPSYILFCAKLGFEPKGGRLLLDAFRQAHAKDNSLRLILVGQELYPRLVMDVPGAEGYGSVPWAQLQALFHGAALFAMPALHEPWGLVYLEALASRTPILGLRRNALPEMSDDGRFGFLVDEPRADSVAETILDAFSDPERLRRMGDAGQEHCLTRYSWDHVARVIATALAIGSAR